MNSKKKAFTKYVKNVQENPKSVETKLARITKYATIVRLIAHTNNAAIYNLRSKRNHIMEIQINGGSIADKVKFGYGLFEKEVKVDSVFKQDEMIDVLGVTKGKGVAGVIKRFGVKHLQKKTHRGYRRVGCIGSWHPARIRFTVARTGQLGYHHRTEANKKIYRISNGSQANSASTA